MTLGTYPEMGLADARLAHAKAKKQLATGNDPGAQLIDRRRTERNAETVRDLIDEYLERHARPNKRSAAADERLLEKDVLPAWGRRKADSITRRDAITLLDRIVDRGSPVMANRTLSALRRVWNFGLDRDIVETTPLARIKPPAKERPRDRVLSPVEITRFWYGLHQTQMTRAVQLALKMILVTAQRRGEVASAQWSEFDLDDEGVWTIPAEKAKNGTANRVPLSPLALELLNQARDLSGGSHWLYPSPRAARPITAGAVSHALRNNLDALGLRAVTPHDLRRTAVSMMTSIGVSRLVTEKIINHKDRGIASVYDRFGYEDEKRDALDRWSSRLQEIIGQTSPSSNVVTLPARG